MSFNMDVKEELTHIVPNCSHCDRALLAALIRIEGTLFISGQGKYRLEIVTDAPSVARLSWRLFHEGYQLRTELTTRRSVLHKTPNYLIDVPAQDSLNDALVDMGVIRDGALQFGVAPDLISKQCCAAAYLRGAFLGSGFVSDPRGDFHFEIAIESGEMAKDIVAIMRDKGINARSMQRRSSHVVYLKSGEGILEFLAFVGAHRSALTMESARVVKSVRNEVNRQTNAEIANQKKAAAASIDQIYAMRSVLEKRGSDFLPPALREVIRLRVAHPEATLKELGDYADPPLSKSAIYHRIRRIEQMARELNL